MTRNGQKVAFAHAGQVRPEVGSRYFLVLDEGAPDSPDGLAVLTGSIQPLTNDTLAEEGTKFARMSPQQVGQALERLTPDPAAAPIAGEDLNARILRVAHGLRSSATG